jgi:hypothetical protein
LGIAQKKSLRGGCPFLDSFEQLLWWQIRREARNQDIEGDDDEKRDERYQPDISRPWILHSLKIDVDEL